MRPTTACTLPAAYTPRFLSSSYIGKASGVTRRKLFHFFYSLSFPLPPHASNKPFYPAEPHRDCQRHHAEPSDVPAAPLVFHILPRSYAFFAGRIDIGDDPLRNIFDQFIALGQIELPFRFSPQFSRCPNLLNVISHCLQEKERYRELARQKAKPSTAAADQTKSRKRAVFRGCAFSAADEGMH